MNTASDGWHQQMENLIGMAPPPPEDPKERAPVGVPFAWIRLNFGQCPEGANKDTIRTYTRVYLWYMISRTLFPDSGGKLAHWCWLKALTVLEHRWSWETSTLAYLYRQLDEACRRTGSGGIGGCLLLLSVWSWDRLSVGRPRILNERPWPHHRNNLDREPTWAYLWDNVSEMTSDPKNMYMHYTEELDTLTAEQECPPQWQDTDHALHSNYLQWFHQSTRIELVKPAYDDDILDDPIEFDEVALNGSVGNIWT
ncbi:protein MAINTENANCE OF MERISTEMS-like [Lolium rigidum]|uniref:protein MAINTENANCE OF MERISTEMS-like n=1 Tax=Lolium rigidum TaxID=89674 RepID=UPI001F5C808D|nr:protein MAINTENANCE OF MERISTEMS-like [Lolium rigidum]